MNNLQQANNAQLDPIARITGLARSVEGTADSLLTRADGTDFQAMRPLMVDIYQASVALRPLIDQQAPQQDPNANPWQGFPLPNQSNDGGSFFAGLVLGAIAGFWLASQTG